MPNRFRSLTLLVAALGACGAPTRSLDDRGARPDTSAARMAVGEVALDHGLDARRYDGMDGRESERALREALLNGTVPLDRRPADYRTQEHDGSATTDLPTPHHPEYEALRAWLPRYRAVAEAGGWIDLSAHHGVTLEAGDRHPAVTDLRFRLAASPDPSEAELAGRGSDRGDVYDPGLVLAVRSFQGRVGLEADGVVGSGTWEALSVPVEERVAQIEGSLEWMRWLPRDFGRELVLWVNLPTFELQAVERYAVELEMPVVVGARPTPTPLLVDTLETVVVNPWWNVPASITRDELAPAQAADPTHLAARGYEVIGPDGTVASPSSIDWSAPDGWPEGLRVRQRPGPGNALGSIKFLFPNHHAVYMHDTPVRAPFERAFRAASHGCVRLADPWALAEFLHDRNVLAADPESRRGSPDPVTIETTRDVPVFFTYLEARVGRQDGAPRFAPPLYSTSEVYTRRSTDG